MEHVFLQRKQLSWWLRSVEVDTYAKGAQPQSRQLLVAEPNAWYHLVKGKRTQHSTGRSMVGAGHAVEVHGDQHHACGS